MATIGGLVADEFGTSTKYIWFIPVTPCSESPISLSAVDAHCRRGLPPLQCVSCSGESRLYLKHFSLLISLSGANTDLLGRRWFLVIGNLVWMSLTTSWTESC